MLSLSYIFPQNTMPVNGVWNHQLTISRVWVFSLKKVKQMTTVQQRSLKHVESLPVKSTLTVQLTEALKY